MFYLETQGYTRPVSLCSGADCIHVVFRINGTHANIEAYDHGCTNSEKPWRLLGSCYNTQFDANPAEEGILRKYGIAEDEFLKVCNKLKEESAIGESDSYN